MPEEGRDGEGEVPLSLVTTSCAIRAFIFFRAAIAAAELLLVP